MKLIMAKIEKMEKRLDDKGIKEVGKIKAEIRN